MFFGTVFGVLFAFEPALTVLSPQETIPTILSMMLASAIFGAFHGGMIIAQSHMPIVPRPDLVIIVWGSVFGAGLFSIFHKLPLLEGARLLPMVSRCVLGLIVGLLSRGIMIGAAKAAGFRNRWER